MQQQNNMLKTVQALTDYCNNYGVEYIFNYTTALLNGKNETHLSIIFEKYGVTKNDLITFSKSRKQNNISK
jgi:hypothetical protein